ncbi:MAG: hypothetical protein HY801_00025 [Candidatus Lindowbacteria bacterium]|nr:hypothetical protein [Candidatus Lindowbacteria bacterium]
MPIMGKMSNLLRGENGRKKRVTLKIQDKEAEAYALVERVYILGGNTDEDDKAQSEKADA